MHIKDRAKKMVKSGDADFIEIVKHSSWALAVFGLAIVAQFIFDLILARNFGADGSGIFYLSFSLLMSVALLGRLGLDRTVVRFIPPLITERNWPRIKGVITSSVTLTLATSVLLSILMFLLSGYLANDIFNEPSIQKYIRIFALSVPSFSLLYLFTGTLRAFKKIKESLLLERVALYGMGAIFILFFGPTLGLDGVVWAISLAILISFVVAYKLTYKFIQKVENADSFSKKLLLASGLPLLLVVFSNQMIGHVNIFFLGALSTVEAVGIFSVALKVTMVMGVVLTAVNSISATKISEVYAQSKDLEPLMGKAAAFSLVVATPIFLIFILAPEFILSLFGESFEVGATALIIMAIGQFVNIASGSVTYILAMTGHEKSLAVSITVFLLINGILSWLLIPMYGINGAAIAIAVSVSLKNILQVFMVKYYLDVWSLPFKTLSSWVRSF